MTTVSDLEVELRCGALESARRRRRAHDRAADPMGGP